MSEQTITPPSAPPSAPPTPPPAAPASGNPESVGAPPSPAPSFVNAEMGFDFAHAAAVLPKELHGAIDGFQARFEGKTVADVFQSFHESETALTQAKQSLSVPTEATLEGYGIERPAELSDADWAAQEAKFTPFLKAAQEGGVGKEGFGQLAEIYSQVEAQRLEAAETATTEARTAAENSLIDKWGNEYHAKGETAGNHAKNVLAELGVTDSPDAQALINNPVFIEIMHNQAQNFGEDPTMLPPGASTAPMSNAERGLDVMNNPDNPHHKKFMEETERGGDNTPTIDWVQSLRQGARKPRGSD